MESITRKSDLKPKVQAFIDCYLQKGKEKGLQYLLDHILSFKIKFPLLEFVGEEIHQQLPKKDHLLFCDELYAKNTMGGLVIIGKLLQLRLEYDVENSIERAEYYISLADEWYICDIIGERVWGYGLRYYTESCFSMVLSRFTSENRWVIRSLGAGSHFAIKRGLDRIYVEQLWLELLKFGKSKDKEIRQGIGWACKTTAKFHPELIQQYNLQLDDRTQIDNWVRRKVKIGLERAEYLRNKRSKI